MSGKEDRTGKEPYEKPELHVVELDAGEVLGTGCKTGSGPDNWSFSNCGISQSCVTQGS